MKLTRKPELDALIFANLAKEGFEVLPQERQNKLRDFIRSANCSDGGFRGLNGKSDPYYSFFGLACSFACGEPVNPRIHSWLIKQTTKKKLTLADIASLIQAIVLCNAPSAILVSKQVSHRDPDASVMQKLFDRIEIFRRKNGGYALNQNESDGSLQGLYLYTIVRASLGIPLKISCRTRAFIRDEAQLSGRKSHEAESLADIPLCTVASAMLALEAICGFKISEYPIRILMSCALKNGGFRISPQIDAPDLLSTASALVSLCIANFKIPAEFLKRTKEFIFSTQTESGGFAPHPFESRPDVEYTFYALISLGVARIGLMPYRHLKDASGMKYLAHGRRTK